MPVGAAQAMHAVLQAQAKANALAMQQYGLVAPKKPDPNAFDWERDYGKLYRACPTAFWLAPEPSERKRDVIDVLSMGDELKVAHLAQNVAYQSQLAAFNGYSAANAGNPYTASGIYGSIQCRLW